MCYSLDHQFIKYVIIAEDDEVLFFCRGRQRYILTQPISNNLQSNAIRFTKQGTIFLA
jgi:hypothetical protein